MRHKSISDPPVVACLLLVFSASVVEAAKPLSLPVEVVQPMSIVSLPAQSPHLYASTDRTHRNKDYVLIAPKTTVTVLTLPGRGWIVRLWLTSDIPESITAKLQRSGGQPSLLLCNRGKAAYTPHPMWAGMVGEAYFCYCPIHCGSKTTLIATNHHTSKPAKFFYQINFRPGDHPPAGEVVKQSPDAVAASWKAGQLYGKGKAQARVIPVSLRSRGVSEIINLPGPGVLTQIMFKCNDIPWDLLRNVWLTVTWDNQIAPDIHAPLPYIFAQYFEWHPFSSLPIEVGQDILALRLPMPFARNAKVGLELRGRSKELKSAIQVIWVPMSRVPPYRLRIRYATTLTVMGKPFEILMTQGSGCLIGYTMGFDGRERRTLGFLEGNDLLEVDGNPRLLQEGTGTEDIFNSAWYFRYGPFARPLHGVTFRNPLPPKASAYRFMFADRVAFHKSLKLSLQHGGRNSTPGCRYRAVVFWYHKTVS